MRPDITIMDKNGNGILAEGLLHIQETTGNKEYVVYTLGEAVDPEQVKIYIAETSSSPGIANPIEDKEWDYLKKVMVSITKKEEIPNIKQLPVEGQTYNTGEAKKLAIKQKALTVFKEIKSSISNSVGIAENVVEPQKTGVFFDQNLLEEKKEETPVIEQTQINAFNTQFELIETPSSSVANDLGLVNGNINAVSANEIPVETPQLVSNMTSNLIGESLAGESLVGNIIETPSMKTETVKESEDKFAEEPIIAEPEVKKEEEKIEKTTPVIAGEVTKDEAINAMVTIIKYMKVQKELSSLLVDGINRVETQTELEPQVLKLDNNVVTPTLEIKTEPTENSTIVIEKFDESKSQDTIDEKEIEEQVSTIELVEIPQQPIEVIEQPVQDTMTNIIQNNIEENTKEEDKLIGINDSAMQTVSETMPTVEIAPPIEQQYQNPMSFEATGTPINNGIAPTQIIDTSVAGIQSASPVLNNEQPINPGAQEVQFVTPTVEMQPLVTQTMQPTTPPPEYNPDYIPDVTPKMVEDYTYQAQGNNSKIDIVPQAGSIDNGPVVVMPDNYKNGATIAQGNNAQLTLGPSGLGFDQNNNIAA